jgi:hypothetical protein
VSPWIALGGLGIIAMFFLIFSWLGYREQIRWFEEYDRRNPGVAEKLGLRSRGKPL